MSRPPVLRWCLTAFALAAVVTLAGLLIAIHLSSAEEVFDAVAAFTRIARWVRPGILAAVLFSWPWLVPALHRRRWISDRLCRQLLTHWEWIAVLVLTLELFLGQRMPVTAVGVYLLWRLFRHVRPVPPFRS